jgi:hypothetical protein
MELRMKLHDVKHERAPVHLVNPMWDASGGSDWRTIDTWRVLRPHADVHLWSEYSPDSAFAQYPVERLRPFRLRFPRHGTLVFVGTYFRIGHWTRLASFERVVLIYNTDQPDRLAKNVERLERAGHLVEVVYTSRALRRRHRGRGRVLESPIDVTRFRPWRIVRPVRPFTVGRLSRDIRSKHHEDDPHLWRALAQAGCRVRLMGATCLAREIGDVANIGTRRSSASWRFAPTRPTRCGWAPRRAAMPCHSIRKNCHGGRSRCSPLAGQRPIAEPRQKR